MGRCATIKDPIPIPCARTALCLWYSVLYRGRRPSKSRVYRGVFAVVRHSDYYGTAAARKIYRDFLPLLIYFVIPYLLGCIQKKFLTCHTDTHTHTRHCCFNETNVPTIQFHPGWLVWSQVSSFAWRYMLFAGRKAMGPQRNSIYRFCLSSFTRRRTLPLLDEIPCSCS